MVPPSSSTIHYSTGGMAMRKFSASAIVALAGSFFLAAPAQDAAATPPAQVSIAGTTHGGRGCPHDTDSVRVRLDATQSAIEIIFDRVAAAAGPGVSAIDMREMCTVSVNLDVPPNTSYAVVAIEHEGYAELASGAKAYVRNAFYEQGTADDSAVENRLQGPFNGAWSFTNRVRDSQLEWSPCNMDRALNLKTSVHITKGASVTSSTVELDRHFTQTYQLVYRACN
jgi:hypothetical protein